MEVSHSLHILRSNGRKSTAGGDSRRAIQDTAVALGPWPLRPVALAFSITTAKCPSLLTVQAKGIRRRAKRDASTHNRRPQVGVPESATRSGISLPPGSVRVSRTCDAMPVVNDAIHQSRQLTSCECRRILRDKSNAASKSKSKNASGGSRYHVGTGL